METIYLDTHVVVWLFEKNLSKLSKKAIELIEEHELMISAMVVLELELLYEIGRVRYEAEKIVSSLAQSINLKVCDEKFISISLESLKMTWTRDPFDRLIVANAGVSLAKLLSKDQNILKYYKKAVW